MNDNQNEKADRFRALHEGAGVFVIPNPWDIGSARMLAGLGFQALATSSTVSRPLHLSFGRNLYRCAGGSLYRHSVGEFQEPRIAVDNPPTTRNMVLR